MKISTKRLRQLIKEELATDDHQEYEKLELAPNEASELRELYQIFKSNLSESTPEMMELDTKIMDKIQQIQVSLNELVK